MRNDRIGLYLNRVKQATVVFFIVANARAVPIRFAGHGKDTGRSRYRRTSVADTNDRANVYCPCIFHTQCFNEDGRELECEDPYNKECPVDHPLYGNSSSHSFINSSTVLPDVNGITWTDHVAVQSVQAALDGFHCRLYLAYQEPDPNAEDTDSTSVFHKYIRKVTGAIPYNYYNESTADDCDNYGGIRYEYPGFFKIRDFNRRTSLNENKYERCCPPRSVWKRFNESGTLVEYVNDELRLSEAYLAEFLKCMDPDFYYWGDDITQRAINDRIKQFYETSTFWIFLLAIVVSISGICFVAYGCNRQIRINKEEALVLDELEESKPQFKQNSDNLLGHGGGGKVYSGTYNGIDVAVKVIDSFESDKSLRNECIIQHSFKTHPYILQIYYPKVEHCVEEQITLIALEKYGWRNKPDQNGNGNEQRTLQDLLFEMLQKGNDGKGNPEWNDRDICDIAWSITKSLVSGIKTLHTGAVENTAGYGKFIKSVVHRDIKLRNIGVKKNSDGAFEAVIADYGLSAVCLKEKGRQRAEEYRTTFQDYIASHMDCLRQSILSDLSYLLPQTNNRGEDQILKLLREQEKDIVGKFQRHRGAVGTPDWMAPELSKEKSGEYYFALPSDWHCKKCGEDRGDGEEGEELIPRQQEMCARCTDAIFEFYRRTDMYSVGLVFWSLLKAVIGSYTGIGSDTADTNDVRSYIDHPLDATTSNQSTSDNHNQAETANLLLAELAKPARRQVINDIIKDNRIELIRQLAEQCCQPNPNERPDAEELDRRITDHEDLNNIHDWKRSKKVKVRTGASLVGLPSSAGLSSNSTKLTTTARSSEYTGDA